MKLDNLVHIPVVDPSGELLEMREISNCPLPELHEDMLEEIILVDWMGSTEDRPDEEKIDEPVWYGGKAYFANKYWGSAVKTGTTIGVTEAFLDKNLVKKAEDGQRVQRYMLGQGHWGGVIDETITLRIVQEGVTTQWGLVADGAGFISKKFAERGNNGTNKIKLGRGRESYTFWQRIKWSDELEAEIMPILKKTIDDASDVSKIITEYSPASYNDKKALYEANNNMQMHPFLVNAIARSSGERLARMATTANVGTKVAVAVPTHANCVVPGHDGDTIIYRHPIDSLGSMQSVSATTKEQKRVEEQEVIQHTVSGYVNGKRFFAKGCFRVVDTDEFDILVCSEDIKMYGGSLENIRMEHEVMFDGVVVFNQWYAKGAAIGVSPKFGKKRMGLDFDGDLVNWIDGEKFPVLYNTIKVQPEQYTDKLKKSTTPLSNRGAMIYKSMMNLVGMATKMATDSYMMDDREYFAREMGYKSAAEMDIELNYWIKVGTDGFKTDIDQAPIRSSMSIFQSKVHNMLGGSAPYSDWPNDWSFKRKVPALWHEEMDKLEAKESIRDFMTGTVPSIARIMLPHLDTIFGEPFKVERLTKFRNYVKQPGDGYYQYAKTMQDWYNARQGKVNWHDSEKVIEFKTRWLKRVEQTLEVSDIEKSHLANALWFVAHDARSEDSGAGSVFMAFHEECLRIVTDLDGLSDEFETMFTGMEHQLPNTEELTAEVEVIDFEVPRKGRTVLRKAVIASVNGQLQPTNEYPENMIAMIAVNANQPELGKYKAVIKRYSNRAHLATLDKID